VPILGNWVGRTGVRPTTPGTVHELSVKVDAHARVYRVEFAITANGTPHSTLVANSPSIRKPNFSTTNSPHPGVASGKAPFNGWGVGLDLSTVPAGTISVVATVYDLGAMSHVLPEAMVIYNDTDGVDRRPRAITLYADGTSGNDANNGTSWAQAVKTIMRARQLGRSGAGDVSGLKIVCRGTFTDLSGGLFPECSTSGAWHVEHIADAAGAYLNPPGDPSPLGPRTIYGGVSGASSSTVTCRTAWRGFRVNGTGIVSYSFGGIIEHWFDGCYSEGTNWAPGRLSVRYAEPAVGGSGSFIGWNGPGPAGRRYFTGCAIRGAVLGFEQSRLVYDCLVRDFTGIACKIGSQASPSVVGALVMRSERYYPRQVEGFVRMDSDVVQGQGRPALVVTKPTGTTARITGPEGGYAFNLDAAELVGTTYWGLRFEGSGARGLDTGVGLLVTAVGNTAGSAWVEVTCPGASAGSIPANTCSFYTARVSSGVNYWNIHPDGIQIERNLVLGDVIFDCAIVDAPNLQSYFTSGNDIDKALIDNLRDDGSGENAGNWNGTNCTDSILQRLTLRGQFQNSGGAGGWNGTFVRNCVFGSLGGDASTIGSRGGTVTNCHVISGSPFGSNGTSGPWFNGDESADPWPFAPALGNRGSGVASVVDPVEWAYSTTGSTRGVLKNIGDLDWSLAPSLTIVTYDHSAHASPRYTAKVQGQTLSIWGRTTDTQGTTPYWSGGANVDQSGATFGSNGTASIEVSLIAGPITAARVYTNNQDGPEIPSTIAGGKLTFDLPNTMTAWCEINGLRGQPLIIRNRPLQTQPTGPTVGIYNGTQTTAVAGRTLVFPPGTHTIGQSFPVPSGAAIWLHGEAWVIGSFHNQGTAGGHAERGHGILSGEWGSSLRATIRGMAHEEALTYSLIYGEFGLTNPSYVEEITLLDPPFYSTFFGLSDVEGLFIVGPWWGNSDAFNLAQQGPTQRGSVLSSTAFIHDNVILLEEYSGAHTYRDCIIGTIASSPIHISFWPQIELTPDTHVLTNITIVCFYPTSGAVKAWSDGSSPDEVVKGGDMTGLRFVGSTFYQMAFWFENKLYPAEWGPQELGLGQITEWTFRDVTFEAVPLVKSIIKGKDINNAPSKIAFWNVQFAGVQLTPANFLNYFEIDGLVHDITVDGVHVDTLLSASFAGSSSASASLYGNLGLRAVASSTSSLQARLNTIGSLSSLMLGSSSLQATLSHITAIGLSAFLPGTSSLYSQLGGTFVLSSMFAGSSSMQANVGGGAAGLSAAFVGSSSFYAILDINYSEANKPDTSPMKQRIFNALLALTTNGPYHEAKVDGKTGQMTVYTTKTVKPVSVDVVEIDKTFAPASKYRRAFNVAEIESWLFEVTIQFSSGLRVSCEQFENERH
jgi:hypothetical protein